MKSNLPEGWHWSTFKEVGKSVTGGTPLKTNASFYSGHIPWVKPPDLDKGKYVFQTPDALTEEGAENARLLPKGSVMISCIGNLGKVAIAGVDLCTNQQINSIIFNEKAVLSEYGYYYALTLKKWLTENSSATTIAIINKGRFEQAPIPVPPLAEQRRIVAQLNAVMQKLEASQERLDKLPDLLKKFRQAVLAAAVSGKLTEAWRAQQAQGETGADLLNHIRAERRAQWEDKQRAKLSGKQLSLNDSWKSKYEEPAAPDTSELPELPEGWAWVRVGDVVSKISDGPFGSNLKSDDYVAEPGFQVIRLENIGWMEFIADKETFINEEKFMSLEKHEVFKGDIIFSSFISSNIRAVLLGELPYRTINKADCFCIRDESGFSSKEFLELALSSETSFRQLVSTIHGSTRPRINTTQLRELIIPLPPFEEQQEIVRQVNHYFEQADQLEARFEQAAALVEQLPQALLAKAFSGQLVPQDPDDEPASALLERLHAEPAAPAKGKRGRKAKVPADAPLFE